MVILIYIIQYFLNLSFSTAVPMVVESLMFEERREEWGGL